MAMCCTNKTPGMGGFLFHYEMAGSRFESATLEFPGAAGSDGRVRSIIASKAILWLSGCNQLVRTIRKRCNGLARGTFEAPEDGYAPGSRTTSTIPSILNLPSPMHLPN